MQLPAEQVALHIVKYFQELILQAQFLHLLIARKALHSFKVMCVPHDEQKPSAKICAWLHVLPLHQNYIYIDLPLPLWSTFSELTEMLSPGPQIKHNWQLHIVHFQFFLSQHLAQFPAGCPFSTFKGGKPPPPTRQFVLIKGTMDI